MTRLFLAAGVAALAIASAAAAKPGGGGGGGGGNPHGGGGGGGHGHGGGGVAVPREQAPAVAGGGGGGRGHGHGGQAVAFGGGGRGHGHGGQAVAFGGGGHGHGRAGQVATQQSRGFAQQQTRGFNRQQARMAERQQFQANRGPQVHQQAFANQQLGGAAFNGKQAKFAERQFAQNVDPATYRTLAYANDVAVAPAYQVERFVGVPVSQVTNVIGLSALPPSIQYLYPDTPAYYYQYGDGYLYQVDRGTSLIAALIPLLAGGYLPGQYLPQPYMASYVPAYYGLNSFYPDYGDTCNRYANGVIYEVDCATGFVEDVIPMYAGGYGVGQILPTAYSYYNVPMQYRTMYYDTPNYGYWYAPGAIYQYDQRSSLITSVAALMAPGFTVGQQLPVGYDVYNVPYDYRATYYDTANAWYRYNNGYIYQVDPVTQVVTAVVASLLT